MSDSIKKWHEMQEEKLDDCCGSDCGCHDDNMSATMEGKFIYESPDGGNTVTERPFMGGIEDRKVIKHPESELKQKAYRLLCDHDEEVIRMAMKILDIGI
tara:strand:- start:106 stop:405 length:300 start_codon:yes stop_codon:yes gene_type:complete